MVGMRVRISKSLQKMKEMPENDMLRRVELLCKQEL